jgi:hypothetical protein
MHHVRSGFVCLVLGVCALAALLYLFPSGSAALGLDVWALPALQAVIEDQARLKARLEEIDREAVRRVLAKEDLAERVADGTLTVTEAAARFRDLDDDLSEEDRRVWREFTDGATDEERYRTSVLRFVAEVCRSRAARATAGSASDEPPAAAQ